MNAHTPRPWTVESDGTTVSMGNQAVVVMPAPDGATISEARANAALIAGAPDLLAVLKDLLDHTCGTDSFCEWCERHAPKDQEGSITGPIPHVSDCLRLGAERAIAKAEGRP